MKASKDTVQKERVIRGRKMEGRKESNASSWKGNSEDVVKIKKWKRKTAGR